MFHQRIPTGLAAARPRSVSRRRTMDWPPRVHCTLCAANKRETKQPSHLPRVSTRVRHAAGSGAETRAEGERERAKEGRWEPTYGHLYAGHGACQAREGAAPVTRGLNRVRADPSFSMLDHVFPAPATLALPSRAPSFTPFHPSGV